MGYRPDIVYCNHCGYPTLKENIECSKCEKPWRVLTEIQENPIQALQDSLEGLKYYQEYIAKEKTMEKKVTRWVSEGFINRLNKGEEACGHRNTLEKTDATPYKLTIEYEEPEPKYLIQTIFEAKLMHPSDSPIRRSKGCWHTVSKEEAEEMLGRRL